MKSAHMIMGIIFLPGIIACTNIETRQDVSREIDHIRFNNNSLSCSLGDVHPRLVDIFVDVPRANMLIREALEEEQEHECNLECHPDTKWGGRAFYYARPGFCLKQYRLLSTAYTICKAEGGVSLVDQDLMLQLLNKLSVREDAHSKAYRRFPYRLFFTYALPKAVQNSDTSKLDKRVIMLAMLHAKLEKTEP